MITENSLILVHFVEQQLEGWTFQRSHWPLHITLVPWFTVDDEEAVVRSLERVTADIRPMRLRVGGIEKFGPKQTVEVNVIRNQAPVRALHEILTATLEEADISFHEEKYIRNDFVAHITRHKRDKRQSNEGEEVALSNYHLVRLVDADTCRVEQGFDLHP